MVSFVILSYNNLKMTKECIESIRNNCEDIEYELILVDNASTDGSASWLLEQKDIKVIANKENAGFPAGCNQGILAAAPGSDIMLLNNDTLVPEKSIKNLIEALYSNEKTGAVGPVSNNCPNYQNVEETGITKENYEDDALKYTSLTNNLYEKRSWLVGFALLIKRSVLDKTGLLDERYTPGNYEDNDICLRILKEGYDILLCHNSFIFHYGSASFGKKSQSFYELLKTNEQKFRDKWNIHPDRYNYIKKELVPFVDKNKPIKVLDVGCGTGATLTRIKYSNPEAVCYGVEINEKAAEIASYIHDNILCDDIDNTNLPGNFKDFDCILAGSILEYVKKPEKVLNYLWSLLKEDGIIIGSVHNSQCTEMCGEGRNTGYSLEELNALLKKTHIDLKDMSYVLTEKSDGIKDISNMEQFVFVTKPKEAYHMSVCIITKNDSQRLKRCLESLAAYPLEVVITDTGSADNTVEMIQNFKASYPKCNIQLTHFPWTDDFAQAKNYATGMAENNLVMVLDSDEWIEEGDFLYIINNLNKNNIGRIKRINMYERNGEKCENREWINRIFYKDTYKYRGRIHEQLVKISDGSMDNEAVKTGITILHDGYAGTKEEIEEKAERNILLLNRLLTEEGENPYILYQIGKSYYMYGEYKKAADYFQKALSFDVNPKLEYVIDMVETYGYALINCGRAQKALEFQGIYEEFGDSADFKFLMGLIYMNNKMFNEALEEFLKATEYKECRMTGTNSFLAYYNAGVIMECLDYKEEAMILYKKCNGYKKAELSIKRLTEKKI